MSMAWRTSFDISKPVVNRPWQKSQLDHKDIWCPFPRAEPQISFSPRYIDDVGFSLYVVGADICSIILSGNAQDSPLPGNIILEPAERLVRAHNIDRDLLAWQDDFSRALTDSRTVTDSPLCGPAINLQWVLYNAESLSTNPT